MSAAEEWPTAGRRVLLIGRSPAVMARTVAELEALGIRAVGDVDPERAADRLDAGAFDVVALGRGVTGPIRTTLRERFLAKNPHVRLLDVMLHETVGRVTGALDGRDPQAVDLDAYLARIGHSGSRAPTIETLRRLVAAHIGSIPFEAIDAVLGKGVDIAPAVVDAKLIGARRGGYCYEQNGLFKRALMALGYEVDGLMGRVLLNAKPGGRPLSRTHMALRVVIDGDPWLADVGFGGFVPPAPLRMDETAPQATPHERYRLSAFGPSRLLEAYVEGAWAPMYELFDQPQLDVDYEPANWFVSTHRSSFFRNQLVAARTTPEARHALFGARLTTRTPDGGVVRDVLSAEEIERALAEVFTLHVQPDWRPVIEEAARQA